MHEYMKIQISHKPGGFMHPPALTVNLQLQ